MTFGQTLWLHRLDNGLTIAQVAKYVPLNKGYLASVERGERPPFDPSNKRRFVALGRVLSISVKTLRRVSADERSVRALNRVGDVWTYGTKNTRHSTRARSGAARSLFGQRQQDHRPSACKRGYDRNWARARAAALAAEPLCRACAAWCCTRCRTIVKEQRANDGSPQWRCTNCGGLRLEPPRVRAAECVHHPKALRAGGARLDRTNQMPLCRRCHRRVEAFERRRPAQ